MYPGSPVTRWTVNVYTPAARVHTLGKGPGGTIASKCPSPFRLNVAHGFSPGFRVFGSATRQLILPVWLAGLVNSTCNRSIAVLVNASTSVEDIVRSAGSIRVAPSMMVVWFPPCMPALGVGAVAGVAHPASAPDASTPIVANTRRAIAPPFGACVVERCGLPASGLSIVPAGDTAGPGGSGLWYPSSPDLHLTLAPAR